EDGEPRRPAVLHREVPQADEGQPGADTRRHRGGRPALQGCLHLEPPRPFLRRADPDSEVITFAKRTAKELKLPATFVPQILQSIQGQLAEFRSYEGQEMQVKEKIMPLKIDLRVNNTTIRDQFLWDIGNLESDPEEFARTLCDDLNITDPEVGPAIAVCIREQLYEIASQTVSAMREAKMSKKRRAPEFASNSKAMNNAVDMFKYFGSKGSVIRKRKEWYLYEPVVDVVPKEEAAVVDAKEQL
uniref:Bushy growth protein n=1 Tax=Aegilops tauschii subsp. strangulata TaxID=200361 RepID=A0A452XXL0_AEGTS